MKLIREYRGMGEYKVLSESNDKTGEEDWFIEGIFLEFDVKNGNGRIYESKEAIDPVKQYNEEFVKTRRALGEMDHSDDPDVLLKNASHVTQSLVIQDNVAMGKAKALRGHPQGDIMISLLKNDVQLAVSSKCLGDTDREGIVQPGWIIRSIDAVWDPSAPSAFVDGVLAEKDFVIQNNVIMESKYAQLQKHLDAKGSREIAEAIKNFLIIPDINK